MDYVGQNAPELIQILAIAIQQKLKVTDLIDFPCLSPSYTEFIYQTAREWSDYHRNQQHKYGWLVGITAAIPNRLRWWE